MFIAFKLKEGRDRDLIIWLESLGEGDRSYHIRETLRRGLELQIPCTLPVIRIQPKQVKEKIEPDKADLESNLLEWVSV